jgi:hypothetical protein
MNSSISVEKAIEVQRAIVKLGGIEIPIADIMYICSEEWEAYKQKHKIISNEDIKQIIEDITKLSQR